MRIKKMSSYACFAAIIFLIITIMFIESMNEENKSLVNSGHIDLSDWNFKENGAVKLSGEWEFYWGKLLESADLKNNLYSDQKEYLHVPSVWNGHTVNGKNLGGEGFATYRSSIRLPEGIETVYVKVYDMSSAYRIYADGKLIGKNGEVSDTQASEKPEFNPEIFKFDREGEWIEIIVQVSNYSHRKGGFWEPIFIGDEKSISDMHHKNMATNFFIMGFIVSMAIYHMIIASLIKKEKAFLFFSIFCTLMSLRLFITGERYAVDLLKDLSWENLQKAEYLSF